MSKITTALALLRNDRTSFYISLLYKFGFFFPDKLFLQLLYKLKMGHSLNLNNPKLFTEKLQWLKLYNRDPQYTIMVDKYSVKQFVADLVGKKYVIPTIGIWDNVESIDWDSLPKKFVLKTTHGGGGSGVYICKDKELFNREEAVRKLKQSMRSDIYRKLREWPYKNVPHRVMAEKYIEDRNGDLSDYKFFCFNGEPKVMLVASNRFTDHNFTYFDMDFNKLDITSVAGSQAVVIPKKPDCFAEMKELAACLSRGLPHVRVDLYASFGRVFFGELTFFDSSGFDNMSSEEWDMKFGKWLQLPNN